EGVAQPLARSRHGRPFGCLLRRGRLGLARAFALAGRRRGRLRWKLGARLGCALAALRRLLALAAGGAALAARFGALLLGAPEERGQGALAHARSLTACHSREPP